MNSIFLVLHITGGTIAISSGMIALFMRKGASWHRKIGNVFFYSMLCMTISASYLAAFYEHSKINTTIALFTLYLVVSAWRTARNRDGKSEIFEVIGLVGILAILSALVIFSIQVSATENGYFEDGIPAPVYYVYSSLALLAALLDIKVIHKGGVYGAQRVARHLWRMTLALFIATASLFLGQPQVFPEALSDPLLRAAPVILVLVMLFFWLVRVFIMRRFRLVRARKGAG